MLVLVGGYVAARPVGFFQQDFFWRHFLYVAAAAGGDQVAGLVVAVLDLLVVPAAGVGAGALVGIPVVHVAREQAATGVGHTQGAVYEDFQLHVRHPVPDLANLIQCQFPGEDDPADALSAPEFYGSPVYRVGLYREMDGLVWPFFPHQHDQAGIRHDQGIGFLLQYRFQIPEVGAYLVVVRCYVGNKVELFAQLVGPFNAGAEGCNVFETVVSYSQRVAGLAGVDSVGAVGKGRFQVFGGPSGGEQFRGVHSGSGGF